MLPSTHFSYSLYEPNDSIVMGYKGGLEKAASYMYVGTALPYTVVLWVQGALVIGNSDPMDSGVHHLQNP